MAHPAQIKFCSKVKEVYPEMFMNCRVLDIGSLDVNGNNRYLFGEDGKYYSYTGVDIGPGDNVDIVSEGGAHKLDLPNNYDIVISTECLEHDKYWKETIAWAIDHLRRGGLLILTCATTGRPEHGTTKSLDWASPYSHLQFDDYYQNLTAEDIRPLVEGKFIPAYFYTNEEAFDLYFYGIKC